MGKYCVRYKGAKVKGAFKPGGKKNSAAEDPEDLMDQGADESAEEPAVLPPAKKKAPFQPEKAVVANMVGVVKPPAKKKGAVPPQFAKKEMGEKGSAKSGNYAHAGIPGKQGGSAPKGSGAGAGGSVSNEHDIYKNIPKGKVPSDYAYDPNTDKMIDRDTGKPVDKDFKPIKAGAVPPPSAVGHDANGHQVVDTPNGWKLDTGYSGKNQDFKKSFGDYQASVIHDAATDKWGYSIWNNVRGGEEKGVNGFSKNLTATITEATSVVEKLPTPKSPSSQTSSQKHGLGYRQGRQG